MLAAALRWLEADPAGRLPLLERLLSTARLPPALAKQKVLMLAARSNAVYELYAPGRSACDQDMLDSKFHSHYIRSFRMAAIFT